MKICRKGLEYVQTYDDNGVVRACPYSLMTYLGNLTEQSMYEIYHGEIAERFRQSLLDGSYRYCIPDVCPYLANDNMDELLVEYEGVPDYPRELSMAHDRRCNYKCTCCRQEHHHITEQQKKNLEKIESELRPFIQQVHTISANGMGELFVSPSILKILSEYKPEQSNIDVVLETNGSLFNEENWKKIENMGKYNLHVCITVMSFDDRTYRYMSGVDYDTKRIVSNLKFVKSLRDQGIINKLELATVVQDRNFRTLPEFTKRCIEEFGADVVRIRPFFHTGADIPEIEWYYDVRNEFHPYHEEYVEVLNDPIFNNPKVLLWSGDEPSLVGKHPGILNRERYDVLKTMFMDEHMPEKIEQFIHSFGAEKLSVYGGGGIGKGFIRLMQMNTMNVFRILDEYCVDNQYCNCPIERINESKPDKDECIVVALTGNIDKIVENLKEKGFKHIIGIEKLVNEASCLK